MPPGLRSYQGDILSLPLPYVRCLLGRSRMCLGRHCRGHPVHVSEVGGCPHMCPWVRPHAPSFGRQLWGLPSRVEYLSPQGVLLPLVYGTTASLLWLELRGHSAWQATPLLDCVLARLSPTGTPWWRPVRTPWRTPTKWTPRKRTSGRGRTPWTGRTRQRPSWRTPLGPRRPTRER